MVIRRQRRGILRILTDQGLPHPLNIDLCPGKSSTSCILFSLELFFRFFAAVSLPADHSCLASCCPQLSRFLLSTAVLLPALHGCLTSCYQCHGTGNGTFCLSGTGAGNGTWMHSGSRYDIKWDDESQKIKKWYGMATFWAKKLLLTLKRQDFIQKFIFEKLC